MNGNYSNYVFGHESLEAVRDASRRLQDLIEQLEYENENLADLVDETLGNGWKKGTRASIEYRAQQLMTNAVEIAATVNEIMKETGKFRLDG